MTQDEKEDRRWSGLGLPRRLGRPENPLLGSAAAAAHMQRCEMSKLHGRNKFGLGTIAAEK